MLTLIIMSMIFMACVDEERKQGPSKTPDHPEDFDPWR